MAGRSALRRGYVLLETVIATGLLVVGLAALGAQFQESQYGVWRMQERVEVLSLAELKLAEFEQDLVDFDVEEELAEEEFGHRYPEYGYRILFEDTAVEDMYLLTLQVLHFPRETADDPFDFDEANVVQTLHFFRTSPQKLDFAADFGLREEELEEMAATLTASGVEGLDPENFDLAFLAKLDMEELVEVLPVIMDAFGMQVDDLLASLPPDMLQMLEGSGMLDQIEGLDETGEEGS